MFVVINNAHFLFHRTLEPPDIAPVETIKPSLLPDMMHTAVDALTSGVRSSEIADDDDEDLAQPLNDSGITASSDADGAANEVC